MLKPKQIIGNQFLIAMTAEKGGMAHVYKAHDILHDPPKAVAVKHYQNTTIEPRYLKEAFSREVDALMGIKHKNIVKYISSGFDDENIPYIVMDWLPSDFNKWIDLNRENILGWDDFYNLFACDFVQALAYSHSKKIAHRDIKPNNIRFDQQGNLHIIDFGICIDSSSEDISDSTLGSFRTKRFSPPSDDWFESPDRRDVYGAAAVCVYAAAKILEIDDKLGFAEILKEVDWPEQIEDIFEKILKCSDDAPLNGEDLSKKLFEIQKDRTSFHNDYIIGLTLKGSVERNLVQNEISKDVIKRDLSEKTHIASHFNREKRSDGVIKLYGIELEYNVKIDDEDDTRFFIIGARRPDSLAEFENKKESAYEITAKYTFGPVPPKLQIDVNNLIDDMLEKERDDEEERRDRKTKKFEDSLFEIIRLKQKSIFEIGRMDFNKTDRSGVLAIPQLKDLNIEIQNIAIKLYSPGGKFLYKGKLNSVDDGYRFITDYVENIIIPPYGSIEIDRDYERRVVESQKETLKSVFNGNTINTRFGDILRDPTLCSSHEVECDFEFFNINLDSDKRRIVGKYLNSQDFCLVEGPPGTGKTDLIIEILRQQIQKDKYSRILVVSQTNVALDNIIERLPKCIDVVRIGDDKNEKISKKVRPHLVSSQIENWGNTIEENCTKFVSDWAKNNGLDPDELKLCALLWRYVSECELLSKEQHKYSNISSNLSINPFDDDLIREEREQKEVVITAKRSITTTEKLLVACGEHGKQWIDDIKREGFEAAKDLVSDYLNDGKVGLGKHLLELNEDWRVSFTRSDEFKETFVLSKQIVFSTCMALDTSKFYNKLYFDLVILDEASKAGMLESITPLARGKKWVLVGDRNQLPPYVDESIQQSAKDNNGDATKCLLLTSLFQYLYDQSPTHAKDFLSIQYRMSPGIADLISLVFYEGTLGSATSREDNEIAEQMGHEIIWLDTSRITHRRDQRSNRGSYYNEQESACIEAILMEIERTVKKRERPYSAMTMSGYNAQIDLIRERLQKYNFQKINYSINSVDACQGKESDIAIFSITRSNEKIASGFMSHKERLNVALSRGKKLLIIIGDKSFASMTGGYLAKIANFCDENPHICEIVAARS